MDATIQRPSVEELSDAILEKLTQTGQLAKLAQANLETLEKEVLENREQLTGQVISKLLGKQA